MSDFHSPSRYVAQWSDLIRALIDTSQQVSGADVSVQRRYADIQDLIGNTLAGLPVIARIRQLLQITPHQEMALWLAALVELDPRLAAQSTVWPLQPLTMQALQAIAFRDNPAAAMTQLSSRGALVGLGLLTIDTATAHLPPSRRLVRASDRTLALVLGSDDFHCDIADARVLLPPTDADAPVAAVPVWRDDQMLVAMGSALSGSTEFMLHSAHALRRRVMMLDAATIDIDDPQCATALRTAAREANLLGLLPLLQNLDAWLADDGKRGTHAGQMLDQHFLRWARGPVLATSGNGRVIDVKERNIVRVEIPSPTTSSSAAMWNIHLGSAALACDNEIDEAALDTLAAQLATRYRLPLGHIPQIVVEASANIAGDQAASLDAERIQQVIRSRMDAGLRSFARRVTVTQTWADLVLPDDEFQQVAEILARVDHREQVFSHWGFAAKGGKAAGLAALFSGPPGTGKTMIAGLIANEVGLDLYQVDTSKIVSKYIGETEKNLAAVFDAAEFGHAILLFDEADSIFGKRTDVKSSNDRNANLETNYLLQRMESFNGICILTSNHEDAIDPAFRRRLAIHVRMPLPEADERAQLWSRMIPSQAPVDQSFDPAALGAAYEMSGGYIKNAVVRAAFYAAADKRAISQADLIYAARLECMAMGKLVMD